jgi:hypothetical protein
MIKNRKMSLSRNILKQLLIIVLSGILGANNVYGQRQREEAPPLRERMFFGGSFALQLGTYTNIEVLPVGGVWILPRIAVAAGPGYRFYKLGGEKTDIWSARGYMQVVILRSIDKFLPIGANTSIFIHGEDEVLSLDSKYWRNVTYEPSRFYVNSFLAGAGISQQLGMRSSMNFMVLWELTESEYDIYANPEFRISLIF